MPGRIKSKVKSVLKRGAHLILRTELLRHPAAVALSFYQMGWLNSPDALMETRNPNAKDREKFGYAYGSIMHNAIQSLRARGNYAIVIYKEIAEDPQNGFKSLFQDLDLQMPENYDAVIEKYCYMSKEKTERRDVERTSRNMIFKRKKELTEQQIADLRAGYLY